MQQHDVVEPDVHQESSSLPTATQPRQIPAWQHQGGAGKHRFFLSVLLLLIIALGWLLRATTIAPYELGTDGGLSVGLAAGPLRQLFLFNARDVHPPLYYLLLRLWIAASGYGWGGLKWLSVAAGAITIAAWARLARDLLGQRQSVIVALALALAPSAVIAGATVRDFSAGLAATSLTVLSFWIVVSKPQPLGPRIALALTTAVAGLIWYFQWPVFVVQLAFAIFWKPARQTRLPLVLGFVGWIPWLVLATPSLLGKLLAGVNSFGVQNASAGLPLTLVFAVLGGWYPGIIPPLLTAAVSLGLALLSLALGWQSGHRPLLTFAALGTLTGTLMVFYVNGHWDPQAGIDRYGLAVLPFVALLTSAFATSRPFFGVVFLAWLAITAPDTLRMPHAQQTVTWSNDPALDLVLSHWHSRDGVAFESIDRLGYYAIRTRSVTNAIAVEDNGSTFERHDAARRIARELPRLEATHKRVWYVQDGKKPGKLLQQALDSSAKLIRRWKTPSGEVRLYLTAPAR